MSSPTTSNVIRPAITSALAVAFMFAVGALVFDSLFNQKCRSGLVAESPSPTRALKALVSVRQCRATREYTTQVSIVEPRQASPDHPNVLAVQLDGGKPAQWSLGGPEVSLTWVADTLLLIRYDHADRVLHSADRVAGVAIQYAALR